MWNLLDNWSTKETNQKYMDAATVKSKVEILQNVVAFSEYINFTNQDLLPLVTLR